MRSDPRRTASSLARGLSVGQAATRRPAANVRLRSAGAPAPPSAKKPSASPVRGAGGQRRHARGDARLGGAQLRRLDRLQNLSTDGGGMGGAGGYSGRLLAKGLVGGKETGFKPLDEKISVRSTNSRMTARR
jgi:hypothetical protein